MTYLDLNMDLTKEDIMLKQAAHEFARDVMRPIAQELDAMSAAETVAAGSPFWIEAPGWMWGTAFWEESLMAWACHWMEKVPFLHPDSTRCMETP